MDAFEKSSPHLIFLAVINAVRFAIEPPLLNIPLPHLTGNPNILSSQFMVTISSSAAAGEAAHPPEKILNPDASESAKAPI